MEPVATEMIKFAVIVPLERSVDKMKIHNKYFRFMEKTRGLIL